MLDRADRFGDSGFQHLAAGNAPCLFRVLSLLCGRCAGFFRVPIGWDASRSGGHLAVFWAAGILAGIGAKQSTLARESVPAAMGVVPDLFRIGRSEDSERRYHMAQLHRDGQLLPERSDAHMDRMVRAAFSTLV